MGTDKKEKGIFDKTWWVKAVNNNAQSLGFTIRAGDITEALANVKSEIPKDFVLAEINEVIH
jgi:hypothetical protein